jgi:hypothetical protein
MQSSQKPKIRFHLLRDTGKYGRRTTARCLTPKILFFSVTWQAVMGATSHQPRVVNFPLLDKGQLKNYAQPDVLSHTFEMLSNLHKLLPSCLSEVLHSYKSEEAKCKCMWGEVNGESF